MRSCLTLVPAPVPVVGTVYALVVLQALPPADCLAAHPLPIVVPFLSLVAFHGCRCLVLRLLLVVLASLLPCPVLSASFPTLPYLSSLSWQPFSVSLSLPTSR